MEMIFSANIIIRKIDLVGLEFVGKMEVPNYPGYTVFPDGTIKGVRKVLKHQVNTSGYYTVVLCNGSGQKQFGIHRLLAELYIPNPENHPVVDHINRDRKDNRLENLRWTTLQQNAWNCTVRKDNSSTGIKGLTYSAKTGIYTAQIQYNKKRYNNTFHSKENAIQWLETKRREFNGGDTSS